MLTELWWAIYFRNFQKGNISLKNQRKNLVIGTKKYLANIYLYEN